MRTTVNLDPRVLEQAKALAAARATTLSSVLEDAMREMLARQEPSRERAEFDLPVLGQRGGAMLVDILDEDALDEALHGDAYRDYRASLAGSAAE